MISLISDVKQYIVLVYIELVGGEYRAEQEATIRKELEEEPYAVIVRGRHSIAAGAGLSHDVVVFVSGALASGLLYDVFKYVVSTIRKTVLRFGDSEVPLNRITFKMQDCDFVVSSNCNAGVCSELVDYNQLLLQMGAFASDERRGTFPSPESKHPVIYAPRNKDGSLYVAVWVTIPFGRSNTRAARGGRRTCTTQRTSPLSN